MSVFASQSVDFDRFVFLFIHELSNSGESHKSDRSCIQLRDSANLLIVSNIDKQSAAHNTPIKTPTETR